MEILFNTQPEPGGRIIARFKTWQELRKNLEKESQLNYIVYCKMKEKYKHLLPKIAERGYAIDEQLPSSLHWSYTLLKVGTKGCRHLRKLLQKKKDFDNSQWPHLINRMEFLNQLKVQFLPYEAGKVIVSMYRTSMVPPARDMQIPLLRNNLYTRKLLYNMKILHDPYCHLCPQKEECRIHRLWSCPH